MDTPEAKKEKMLKRANNSKIFALDDFFSEKEEEFVPDEPLNFSEDLHKVLEERKLYTFSAPEENPAYVQPMEPAPPLRRKEALTYIDVWEIKKKKRDSPMHWEQMSSRKEHYYNDELPYVKHPVEQKTQKLFLGVIKKPPVIHEKNTMNSILPLYLNSTTSFEGPMQRSEFLKISQNFIKRVDGIDYEALTVQQLKSIMKEFGLNYTGKKHELINRIQQTYKKIVEKKEKEGISAAIDKDKASEDSKREKEELTAESSNSSSFGYMFF